MTVAAGAYARIAEAIRYLDAHATRQPSLQALADHLGCSPFHLNRLFGDFAGVTPKRFLQVLTRNHARTALRESASVLDAALASGLSGPGRLHDLLVNCDAMSPGEIARGGADLTLRWGVGETPFGKAFVAETTRGICRLDFLDDGAGAEDSLAALRREFPGARCLADPQRAELLLRAVFAATQQKQGRTPLRVWLRGTNFQVQVWQALLRVPSGQRVSYGSLARAIGRPRAARAIGNAVAANAVAALIPCHRVIRESGVCGPYRWGAPRKVALLAWEAVQGDAGAAVASAG